MYLLIRPDRLTLYILSLVPFELYLLSCLCPLSGFTLRKKIIATNIEKKLLVLFYTYVTHKKALPSQLLLTDLASIRQLTPN